MNHPWLAAVSNALTFVRFSHTIFALPFALMSMLAAAGGWPTLRVALLILLCMVSARTAAMAFNRCVDWELDKDNPRTEGRHKLVSKWVGWTMVWLGGFGLVVGAWLLNPLCFLLCPLALALIFFYSLTKRFTEWSHAFLGLALAAAPMGAWVAVQGTLLVWAPWVLALAVLLWVFGFDLIYATQDAEFDRKAGLYSFPAKHGISASLRLAGGLHALAWLVLGLFGWLCGFGWIYLAGWLLAGGALIYEHRLAATGNLEKINVAFFQANAFVGLVMLTSVMVEVLG